MKRFLGIKSEALDEKNSKKPGDLFQTGGCLCWAENEDKAPSSIWKILNLRELMVNTSTSEILHRNFLEPSLETAPFFKSCN